MTWRLPARPECEVKPLSTLRSGATARLPTSSRPKPTFGRRRPKSYGGQAEDGPPAPRPDPTSRDSGAFPSPGSFYQAHCGPPDRSPVDKSWGLRPVSRVDNRQKPAICKTLTMFRGGVLWGRIEGLHIASLRKASII